jgi:hypothetical protein
VYDNEHISVCSKLRIAEIGHGRNWQGGMRVFLNGIMCKLSCIDFSQVPPSLFSRKHITV